MRKKLHEAIPIIEKLKDTPYKQAFILIVVDDGEKTTSTLVEECSSNFMLTNIDVVRHVLISRILNPKPPKKERE